MKAFDRVLWRNGNDANWKIGLYSNYDGQTHWVDNHKAEHVVPYCEALEPWIGKSDNLILGIGTTPEGEEHNLVLTDFSELPQMLDEFIEIKLLSSKHQVEE